MSVAKYPSQLRRYPQRTAYASNQLADPVDDYTGNCALIREFQAANC
jgi:hypothetical protein